MSPEERVRGLINSIGAIAEMLKIFYDKSIDQGFSNQQALYLSGVFLETCINTSNKDDDSD